MLYAMRIWSAPRGDLARVLSCWRCERALERLLDLRDGCWATLDVYWATAAHRTTPTAEAGGSRMKSLAVILIYSLWLFSR